jgi:hypothetical protein
VPTEHARIISPIEHHEVVELRELFELLVAEQVELIIDNRIEKIVSCGHVLPHRVWRSSSHAPSAHGKRSPFEKGTILALEFRL